MRVQLLSKPIREFSPIVQVLLNRGMPSAEIQNYLTSSIETSVSIPEIGFDEEKLKAGVTMLINHIKNNDKVFVIQDSDVDGMTSAAILINYLHDLFPSFVENNISWGFHSGKQHGLNDFVNSLLNSDYKLIICPDSGTGDVNEVNSLKEKGIDVLVLDHHPFDNVVDTVVINSQYDYPNKELSGAGVVWQFCRYIDKLLNKDEAFKYIDLCALGNQADMMSILSVETKTIIFEGCKDKNISNPLIRSSIEKNEYSFSKADYRPSEKNGLLVSPMGLSFFLIPQMNAICRSGTAEEKALIFDAMLNFRAFDIVPSTKRGHKLGETERKLDQALRTLTNVKNRQTRIENATLELFEGRIAENNLLDHKVLLILTEPGEVDRNVAGLVANKLMAKYQRPCCVLTKVSNMGETTYQGSMRGYARTGISSFKEVAEGSRGCAWVKGHPNAAGLCLDASLIEEFIKDTDSQLSAISADPIYYVDYIFQSDNINGDTILDLSYMNDYLGQDFERPLVLIENIQIDESNIAVYKGNTLKISTPSGIDIMQFSADEDFIEKCRQGITINTVCRCNENIFNWQRLPQLIIEDYEILDVPKEKNMLKSWGF